MFVHSRGFTLVELLVVMMVLGVLAGIGIGFLQRRGSEMEIALAAVRDQVRKAGLTARKDRAPASVELVPGVDGEAAVVRARTLVPVEQWSMEEGHRGDARTEPNVLSGGIEPGRFGMARRPTDAAPCLELATGEMRYTLFDLRDGFTLSIDLKLDERAEMVLASLDRNLVLELDQDLFPRAKLVAAGRDAAEGSIELESRRAVPLDTWTTVSVVHDGTYAYLYVDEVEGDRASFRGSLWQTDNDTFRVSEPQAPVLGLVDEVRLSSYEFADDQILPVGVELVAETRRIAFGPDGRVTAPVEFTLVFGEERETHRVDPGGLVE